MAIKVLIEPVADGYRARCRQFELELTAPSKAEASRRMNEAIREVVERLKREGRLKEPAEGPACPSAADCAQKGCGGCH